MPAWCLGGHRFESCPVLLIISFSEESTSQNHKFFSFFVTSIDLTYDTHLLCTCFRIDGIKEINVTRYFRCKQAIKFVNTSNLCRVCLFCQHKCKVRLSTSCTALLLGESTVVTASKKETIFMITYTYNKPLSSFRFNCCVEQTNSTMISCIGRIILSLACPLRNRVTSVFKRIQR